MLQKLANNGVTFVAYHPGMEHLAIHLNELPEYLDSPGHYVAKLCSVDQELYQQWLEHFELPVCNHRTESGLRCGEPLVKVDKPGRFIPNESDRCAKHGSVGNTLNNLIRMRESS